MKVRTTKMAVPVAVRCFASVALMAGMLASISTVSTAADVERRYCFSDICPGDPTSVLAPIVLSSLDKVAARQRAKDSLAGLEIALPGLGRVARATLASYADASGSLLVDQRTLPIVLQIDRICGPTGPFVSMFSSESGHPTSVEFQAIASDGAVRLGVTRVARSFQVKAGTSEERALIADLSEKFGFQIDEDAEKQLPPGRPPAVTATFVRQANGFMVSFARRPLSDGAPEFHAHAGCGPATRIKID